MNKSISDILTSNLSNDEKSKKLDDLAKDINIARDILSGKLCYCKECNDYYLSKSFLTERETKAARICIYEDLINSGGNDYADGYADITYSVCPKGHKHEMNRIERLK